MALRQLLLFFSKPKTMPKYCSEITQRINFYEKSIKIYKISIVKTLLYPEFDVKKTIVSNCLLFMKLLKNSYAELTLL